MRLPLTLLCVCACQDPRLDFEGAWTGTATREFRFDSGRTATLEQDFAITIDAPEDSEAVRISRCDTWATVYGGGLGFRSAGPCPPESVTIRLNFDDADTACDVTEAVDSFYAEPPGVSLVGAFGGTGVASGCTAGPYHYTWRFSLTR